MKKFRLLFLIALFPLLAFSQNNKTDVVVFTDLAIADSSSAALTTSREYYNSVHVSWTTAGGTLNATAEIETSNYADSLFVDYAANMSFTLDAASGSRIFSFGGPTNTAGSKYFKLKIIDNACTGAVIQAKWTRESVR